MEELTTTKIFKSEIETAEFGMKLGETLKKGDIIALTGDLGAGKTTLARAIARGLGIRGPVTSPTFTILQEYEEGRLPLYHFDVYRIDDPDELFELGFEDYFFGEGVSVVEWADKIKDFLPRETILIHISYGDTENQRLCRIDGRVDKQ